MKKITLILGLAVAGMFTANNSQAQESFGSAGLELALPVGDFGDAYGIGIGATVGYEFGVSENIGIGAEVGYIMMTGKDIEVMGTEVEGESSGLIPIQVYGRYHFSEPREGAFLSLKTGLYMQSYKVPTITGDEETNTDANFSFAPEFGYFLSENFSLALRYQMIFAKTETLVLNPTPDNPFNMETEEESTSYGFIGLRIAYAF